LGEVDRYRRFPDSALKILNRDHATGVFRRSIGSSSKNAAHIVELCEGVSLTAIIIGAQWLGQTPVLFSVADRRRCTVHKLGSLAD